MRWIGVSLVLSLVAAGSVTAQSPTPVPDSVAIAGLLGGNVLVPLAQYTDGRWVRTWPIPDQQVDAPIRDSRDVPGSWYPNPGGVPREWRLWTEGASIDAPLSTGAPVLGQAHCQAVWGLSTSLREDGHETTAIAVHGSARVQSFVPGTVDPVADEDLFAFLEHHASRLKSDAIGHALAKLERPYDVSCARREDGADLCEFEGIRTVSGPADSDEGSDQVLVVEGWFSKGPDGPTYLQGKATLTDSDFKDFRFVFPLVLVGTDARTFVVLKEHGYEDESFRIVEVRGRLLEERLEIEGGGC